MCKALVPLKSNRGHAAPHLKPPRRHGDFSVMKRFAPHKEHVSYSLSCEPGMGMCRLLICFASAAGRIAHPRGRVNPPLTFGGDALRIGAMQVNEYNWVQGQEARVRDGVVLRSFEAGTSVGQLAKIYGLSRTRIYFLLARARRRREEGRVNV